MFGEPALYYVLKELVAKKVKVDAVFIDSKFSNKKDKEIWNERTGDCLPGFDLSEFSTSPIPFYLVDRHDSEETASLIQALEIDLLVNGVTHRILKSHTIRSVSLGVINVHPGILPFFKGCTCVEWAVYLDEKIGNTVHFMNEKIDGGEIIRTSELFFDDCENYQDLRVKVYNDGFRLLATSVVQLLNSSNGSKFVKQKDEGNYFKVIDLKKLEIVKTKIKQRKYKYQKVCK